MSVKDRLKDFIKYKGLSIRKFEELSQLNYGYINGIRVSIQPDKVKSIASGFPDLNTGWLLTGEGEMLKQDTIKGQGINELKSMDENLTSTNLKDEEMIKKIRDLEETNEILLEKIRTLKLENESLKSENDFHKKKDA